MYLLHCSVHWPAQPEPARRCLGSPGDAGDSMPSCTGRTSAAPRASRDKIAKLVARSVAQAQDRPHAAQVRKPHASAAHPPVTPDDLEAALRKHDPSTELLELVVAGAGPSGLAVAERVSSAGVAIAASQVHLLSWSACLTGSQKYYPTPPATARVRNIALTCAGFKVCVVDPAPLRVWPNNYGVWVDEFAAMGLDDCIELVWPQARVYLDSTSTGEK